MEDNITKMAVCPICGKGYSGHPALSRKDNKTLICPDCGTIEALDAIGISETEKKEIIDTIHEHSGNIHTFKG